MKNPFYDPAVANPPEVPEESAALEAARAYLKSGAAEEEIPDAKVRRMHPALADDTVWAKVRENLTGEPARRKKGE